MSTTIDEKVVEMRFDNQHFEKNVSQTMSTLDKFKQKLNLTGASKGLENVDRAAKNVDMRGLGSAVETVGTKFSALQVMGVTALANITNSAVNAGKRIVSALTIDPVKTGFSEYETQINATQTILANTQSKGTTIDDVNKALEELNTYADKTIYNFTEMTRNIGTFTAAGVDLDTSVKAIQGIANLAAVSGSTSQQASTAMYQLSQALSSGTVKLMDWNSVVNAGMGGEVFQNALKETARIHGVAIDEMIASQGSFRETLSEGWLTSEILTETLEKFTLAAEEGSEQWEKYKKSLMDQGYTAAQAEEILKLGNTATDAATKVKTFTQLWDVLKEAAQSGWSKTWKILIGDFEQAKSILTPLSDTLTGFINNMSDWRNKILETALGMNPFKGLSDKINSILQPVETAKKALDDLDTIAKRVINMEFKTTDTGRRELLMAEGYNWAKVQNRVNEMLGNTVRHSEEAAEAELKLYQAEHGLTQQTTESAKARANSLTQLLAMTDAELEAIGFTKEEIKAFRELEEQSKKTGLSIEEILKNTDQLSGRSLLINSFKNAGQALAETFGVLKEAWRDVFPEKSIEVRAQSLYDLIAALHKFTASIPALRDEEGNLTDTGEKLKRTFAGVVAVVDLLTSIFGGAFKIGFKVIREVLSYFNIDVLDLTAGIGDAIVAFRDWLKDIFSIQGALDKIIPPLKNVIEGVKEWVAGLKEADNLPKYIADGIVKAFSKIGDVINKVFSKIRSTISGGFGDNTMVGGFIDGLRNGFSIAGQVIVELGKMALEKLNGVLTAHGLKEISGDTIAGLVEGLKGGVGKVWDAALEIGKSILESIKEFLGIHSPATTMIAIGGFIIAGLVLGLTNGEGTLSETISGLASKITEWFGNIDWGSLFAVGISAAIALFVKKIADGIGGFGSFMDGLGSLLEDTGDGVKKVLKSTAKVVKSFGKVLSSASLWISAKAIVEVAKALAILVAAVVVLAFIPSEKLWPAIGALAAIVGMLSLLIGMTALLAKFSGSVQDGLAGFGKISLLLLGIAGVLLSMAFVVKMVGSMDSDTANQGFLGLTALIVGMLGMVYMLDKISQTANIDEVSKTLLKITGVLLILAIAIRLMRKVEWEDIGKAGVMLGGLFVFVLGLAAINKKLPVNDITSLGSTFLQISGALAILAITCRLLRKVEWGDLGKAGAMLGGLFIFILGLATINKKLPVGSMGNLGTTLLAIAGAMAILAIVAKLMAGMDEKEFGSAAAGLAMLTGVIAVLVGITKLVDKDAPKMAATLIAMATAIGILAVVAMVLSLIKLPALAKGIIAVGLLAAFVGALIWVTKDAKECAGTIYAMAVTIAVMAAAVALLSMIDRTKLENAVTALGTLMLCFAAIVYASKNANASIGTLIVMTIAVGMIAGLLYLLATLPVGTVTPAAIALSSVLVVMTGILVVLGACNKWVKNALDGVIGLVGISIALVGVAGALLMLKDVNNAVSSATALAILIGAMTVVLVVLSTVNAKTSSALQSALSLAILSASLFVLVAVLATMSQVQNAMANATALGLLVVIMAGVLVVLGAAEPIVKGAMKGVVAMLALSASLVVLATALSIMGGMGWDGIAKSLVALAGAFLIIGVAAFALSGLSGIILALSAAFLMIGVGVIAAGVGLNTVALGISALSLALATGAPGIVMGLMVIITGMKTLVPMMLQIFGNGIVQLCGIIVQAAPAIVMAITTVLLALIAAITVVVPRIVQLAVTLITSFLNAMITLVPKIVETGVVIVTALLDGLLTLIPKVVDAGLKIIVGILEGISNNIADIVIMATKIVTEFIRGISESLPSIIQSGVDLILAFINGLADAINGNTEPLISAVNKLMDAVINAIKKWFSNFVEKGGELVEKLGGGIKDGIGKAKEAIGKIITAIKDKITEKISDLKEAGKNIIDGFIGGIKDKISSVGDAASEIGKKALNSIKDFLGIKSPSKEFALVGRYSDEGMIVGLNKYSKGVYAATENIGDTALNSMSNAISRITDLVNTDINSEPVIRPVLDLTNVQSGASTINGLFNSNSMIGVRSTAGSISLSMNQRSQNGRNDDVVSELSKLRKDIGNVGGTTYQFGNVTYDDGTAVASAVGQLIRALKIEGRA